MRVLSAEAMREVDRRAVEEVGIPSLVLMENAALGLAEAVADLGDGVESVAIFCGPGNNGGDGLALARHLDARGYDIQVFLAALGRELSGDPAVQLAICRFQGIEIDALAPDDDPAAALAVAREADLVVDALFGTGLGRPLEGRLAELVGGLNELPVPVLSVDLPSGLNGSRTDVFGPAVEADLTVTLAAPKPANLLGAAAELGGDLVVADLGIPPRLLDEAGEPGGRLFLLRAEELAAELPARPPDAHKGSFGHGVVVAGSPGKAGAVVLTLRGAVRAGAGLVTAAVPEALLTPVDLGSLESMTLPLPASASGQIGEAAVDRLLSFLDGKSALAVGPGLGQEEETAAAVRRLVLEAPLPLVLDADGVNAFAGRAAELSGRRAATVLTPHPGELGRLLGIDTAEIQRDRPAAVRRAVAETGAVVILKGRHTLVGAPGPDGADAADVWICPTGNPGMATGGSGDVLTGVVLALLGQVDDAVTAACLAVYLHGLAGDLAAERLGERALAAADLPEALSEAFRVLEPYR